MNTCHGEEGGPAPLLREASRKDACGKDEEVSADLHGPMSRNCCSNAQAVDNPGGEPIAARRVQQTWGQSCSSACSTKRRDGASGEWRARAAAPFLGLACIVLLLSALGLVDSHGQDDLGLQVGVAATSVLCSHSRHAISLICSTLLEPAVCQRGPDQRQRQR